MSIANYGTVTFALTGGRAPKTYTVDQDFYVAKGGCSMFGQPTDCWQSHSVDALRELAEETGLAGKYRVTIETDPDDERWEGRECSWSNTVTVIISSWGGGATDPRQVGTFIQPTADTVLSVELIVSVSGGPFTGRDCDLGWFITTLMQDTIYVTELEFQGITATGFYPTISEIDIPWQCCSGKPDSQQSCPDEPRYLLSYERIGDAPATDQELPTG